jgi:EmrB/QacA subfamily drug resistance transporter
LFILGLGVFTGASALCGASAWIGDQIGVSGVNVLIFSRVLQGIGGAFMMPQSLSLLTVAFPPEKRGAALGLWGSVVAMGAIVGPILGGLIATDYAWEWIFLINVPVGIFAIFATMRIVPESTDPLATRKFDWGGVLFSGAGIFCIVFASIEGNHWGWTSPLILGLYLLGVALLVAFVLWERRVADPMVKLELFQIRNFWVGNVIALIIAFGMLGIFFPMTLFLQQALGFSPIRAGLTMIPMSATIMIAAPLAGRLTDRIGARWILFSGTSLMTIGILFLIQRISLQSDWQGLMPALAVSGLGMGMTFSPMTAATMREVPNRIAGSASGILNTMRNIGQVLGIAILGSFLQNRMRFHTSEEIDGLGLPDEMASRVASLSAQNQFMAIQELVPSDLVGAVMAATQSAFVSAIHNTFFLGAVSCAVGAAFALLIRNPRIESVAVTESASGQPSERPELVAVD